MTTIEAMTAAEAAKALDGNEYGKEGSRELFARMKAAGLVAVFGASDDLIEFRGAIEDEVGAYDGGAASVDGKGLVVNNCRDGDDCPNWKQRGRLIEAIWCDEADEAPWTYSTNIPHETFTIMEDGAPYCRGIVFRLADAALAEVPAP